MAIFGYNTIGGTTNQSIENTIAGTRFSISENGTVTSISAYINNTSSIKNMKCAIYSSDGNTKIGETEQLAITTGTSWRTFNTSGTINLTGGITYLLLVWSASGTGGATFYFDAGTTNQSCTDSETYGTWPVPLVETDNNNKYSIYCTYAPPATLQKNSNIIYRVLSNSQQNSNIIYRTSTTLQSNKNIDYRVFSSLQNNKKISYKTQDINVRNLNIVYKASIILYNNTGVVYQIHTISFEQSNQNVSYRIQGTSLHNANIVYRTSNILSSIINILYKINIISNYKTYTIFRAYSSLQNNFSVAYFTNLIEPKIHPVIYRLFTTTQSVQNIIYKIFTNLSKNSSITYRIKNEFSHIDYIIYRIQSSLNNNRDIIYYISIFVTNSTNIIYQIESTDVSTGQITNIIYDVRNITKIIKTKALSIVFNVKTIPIRIRDRENWPTIGENVQKPIISDHYRPWER